MEAGIVTQLGTYGLPGIVIIALGYVVLHLYRKNESLQDSRIDDLKQVIGKVEDVVDRNTTVVQQNSQVLDKNSEALKLSARKAGRS